MPSDNKKVQSMINAGATAIQTIRAAIEVLEAIEVKFGIHDPSVTGTALQGNKTALATSIDNLRAEVDKTVWTTIEAAVVPSHNGKALD